MEKQSEQLQQLLRLNQEQTHQLHNSETYIKYKEWLAANGVVVSDAVLYPACFHPNIIGIGAKCSIPPLEAVISIPHHLIINAHNIKKDLKINKIIQEYALLFGPNTENQFAILLLFLCREFAKGDESFYSPYLKICENNKQQQWSHWDMLALEDSETMRQMKRQNQRISIFFSSFISIFRKEPEVFPAQVTDSQYRAILEKSYHIITTRSFGWPLPYRSLIPMADSLNHSNSNYVTHMLIKRGSQNPKLSNFNLANLQFSQTAKSEPQKQKTKKSKVDRFIQKHEQQHQLNQLAGKKEKFDFILWTQYREGRKFSHLHYYDDSCSEDNDSDEEEKSKWWKKTQQFQLVQRKNGLSLNQNNKIECLVRYWRLYLDESSLVHPQTSNLRRKSGSESLQEQMEEGSEQKQEGLQSVSLSSTSSQSLQEEGVLGFSEKGEQIQSAFVVYTRKRMQKNEQLFNFYGRRSNRFLLVGYNFILDHNKYDSFAFRISLDNLNEMPNALRISKSASACIARTRNPISMMCSRQIRLQGQRISLQLINHCRALLLGWLNLDELQKKENTGEIKITVPFCREFEQKTLKLACEFVLTLLSEFMTSAEQDRKMLSKCQRYNMQCAIKFRIIQKQILQKHIQMLRLCAVCLEGWSCGRMLVTEWGSMRRLGPIRDYLICLEKSAI